MSVFPAHLKVDENIDTHLLNFAGGSVVLLGNGLGIKDVHCLKMQFQLSKFCTGLVITTLYPDSSSFPTNEYCGCPRYSNVF